MSKFKDEIEWREFLRRVAEAKRRYSGPAKQTTIITKRPLPLRRSRELHTETETRLPELEEAGMEESNGSR